MRPSFALAALGTCLLVLGVLLLPATGCGCSRFDPSLANVRHQALGLLQYAGDHDDRLPARDVWMDAIVPYVRDEGAFHDEGMTAGTYGYAFNAALSRARQPEDPYAVPMNYQSVDPIRNASDPVTSLPRPGRHRGKNAVAYADGHARMVAP